MPFKKNISGNPSGKPKGAKNKTTTELKEFVHNFVSRNVDTLQTDFDNLEPRERVLFIERLLRYVLPTKAHTEIVSDPPNPRQLIHLSSGHIIDIS